MSLKLYNVGVYIRLSRESTAYRETESMSIQNQQAMLSKFISMMPGWVERRVYIDDGASGGNFNRRGFQDMMEDVRQGIINLVLVQDLSRFGRNYLEAGKYLEEELPSLECRFVALSDGIDTETGENDIIPFLNAMNDYYLKNLSDKIKLSLVAKARDGQKLSGSVAYGYKRNPQDRTRLIVDEDAAIVVKRVFEMRSEGMGYAKIAGVLNREGLLSPGSTIWKTSTIKRLLVNESYIGHTVSFKRKPRSYRNGKGGVRYESEWIRVENTHMPIIDIALWQKVQELGQAVKSKFLHSRKPQPSLFSNLIVCADCYTNMTYQVDRKNNPVKGITLYGSYHCKTYTNSGGAVCSWHRVSEMALKKIVRTHIKEQAALTELDEDRILKDLQLKLLNSRTISNSAATKQHRELKQQMHRLEIYLEQLYEDRVSGKISTETFAALANETEAQQNRIEERLLFLAQTEQHNETKAINISRWIGLIKEKSKFEDADRDLLEVLIERIEVSEKQTMNNIKTQDIKIYWKYAGLC